MDNVTITKSKAYKRKIPILWWTKRKSHIRFIVRELTSISVAFFAVILLLLIRSVSKGPDAYAGFIETLQSPFLIVLHIIAFVGLIFHSVTWFNLAPKAMVIKMGDKQAPGVLVALLNYAGWIIISVVIIWLLLR